MVWDFSRQPRGEKKNYVYTYSIRLMLCISYDLFALVLQYSSVTLPWSSLSLHFNYRPYLFPLQRRTWSCKFWTDKFPSAGAGSIIQNLWFSHLCYFDEPASIRVGKEGEQTYCEPRDNCSETDIYVGVVDLPLSGWSPVSHYTTRCETTVTLVLLCTIILALESA